MKITTELVMALALELILFLVVIYVVRKMLQGQWESLENRGIDLRGAIDCLKQLAQRADEHNQISREMRAEMVEHHKELVNASNARMVKGTEEHTSATAERKAIQETLGRLEGEIRKKG